MALSLAAAFAVIALGVGFVYNRQIRSILTQKVGSPEHDVPVAPLPSADQPDQRWAVIGDVGDGGDLEWRPAATMDVAGREDPYDLEQLAWLEDTLAASDAPWRIAAVHQPPYSAGYQGSDRAVREAFSPIFERHGVQLVLSGHDHDYQRSVPIGGVTYVVSGAGAGSPRTGTEDYTAYSAAVLSYVDVGVYPDRLLLRAIDHELMVFDEFSITG